MQEERFFFENEGAHVYAVLHRPADSAPVRTGVVICHPVLDFDLYEVPWAIRMVVTYARDLASRGIPCLRFDFRGSGQSDGEFETLTLSSCVSDLQRAIDLLIQETGVEEIVLIGLRLAGTVAMRVGAHDPRVRRLVLWDPVPDPHGSLLAVGRRARASMLAMGRAPERGSGDRPAADGNTAARRAPTGDAPGASWGSMQPGDGPLDAGGYVIGTDFLRELKVWDSREDVAAFKGQVLILQLVRGWSGGHGMRRPLVELAAAYRAAGAECELAEAMDVHPAEWFKQPEYVRVHDATTAWLDQATVSAR